MAAVLAVSALVLVRLVRAQGPDPAITATVVSGRQTVFPGEVFTLALSVRTVGLRLGELSDLSGLPDQTRLNLGDFRELPTSRALEGNGIVETRRYRARAWAAVPGVIEIAPVLTVNVLAEREPDGGPRFEEEPRAVRVDPLVLRVAALPEADRPEGFSGAVGRLEFHAAVFPSNIVPGDLVSLTMTIHGSGLAELVSPPGIAALPDLKVYDLAPIAADPTALRQFEQIVVPQSATVTSLPPVAFSFFDPGIASYRTIVRGPFPLSFRPGTESADVPLSSTPYPAPRGTRAPKAWTFALLVSLASLALTGRRWRRRPDARFRRRAFLLSGVAAAVSVVGIVAETAGMRSNALVVGDETARLAPSVSAVPLFELPRGTRVLAVSRYRDWTRIACRAGSAWVPSRTLSPAAAMTND